MSNVDLGWWIPEQDPKLKHPRAPRWVLSSTDEGILYSKGDRLHFECKQETFQRWARRFKAVRESQR